MSDILIYEDYQIPTGLTTKVFDVSNSISVYRLLGSVTLLADVTLSLGGTPQEGMNVKFVYTGGVTIEANALTILGFGLTADMAVSQYTFDCNYIDGNWYIQVIGFNFSSSYTMSGVSILPASITTDVMFDDNVITLPKLANGTQGDIIRAGASGVYESYSASTDGYMLIGDGTDVNSVEITGAININNAGLVTIPDGTITLPMLGYTPQEYLVATLTIPTASVLIGNGTPLTIVANPGSGRYIEVISASSQMTFVTTPYATNTTLQLICNGADVAQVQDTAILLSSVTKNTKFKDVTSAIAGQTQLLSNTALMVKVATGNPTAGDSAITVSVVYRIVTI